MPGGQEDGHRAPQDGLEQQQRPPRHHQVSQGLARGSQLLCPRVLMYLVSVNGVEVEGMLKGPPKRGETGEL